MSSESPSPAPANNDVVVRTDQIGKTYRIWDRPSSRIMTPAVETMASLFPMDSKPGSFLRKRAASHYRDFHALQNVTLELRRGEALGIIGRNGSGKSTLLQILAGTLRPTTGEFFIEGRVAALLELGSGFNPEFTGRENVMLNGAILGLRRTEMEERFAAVEEFAEIGDFIEQPTKTYSSGMMVRLAFAVQTMVDPEILIIDEALSVGDIFFQQKCFRRLEELREKGVAIMLVSHGMNTVEQYCDRALLLDRGRVHAAGPAAEVVKQYYLVHRDADRSHHQSPATARVCKESVDRGDGWPRPEAFFDISKVRQINDGTARCMSVGMTDTNMQPCRFLEQGQTAFFFAEYEVLAGMETPVVGMLIFNDKGIIVHGKNTLEHGVSMPQRAPTGTILRLKQTIRLDIQIGFYTIEVGIGSIRNSDLRFAAEMTHEQLTDCVARHCHLTGIGPIEIGFRRMGLPVQLLHHGVANLEGSMELISKTG